jgi:hypothetical protein
LDDSLENVLSFKVITTLLSVGFDYALDHQETMHYIANLGQSIQEKDCSECKVYKVIFINLKLADRLEEV